MRQHLSCQGYFVELDRVEHRKREERRRKIPMEDQVGHMYMVEININSPQPLRRIYITLTTLTTLVKVFLFHKFRYVDYRVHGNQGAQTVQAVQAVTIDATF